MLLFKKIEALLCLLIFAFNDTTVNVPNDLIKNTNKRGLRSSGTKYFFP